MRRVRRILWNVATVGSLVVCLAAAGMWVRSYRVSDQWWRSATSSERREELTTNIDLVRAVCVTSRGRVRMGRVIPLVSSLADARRAQWYYFTTGPWDMSVDSLNWEALGFRFLRERRSYLEIQAIDVPLYAPVALTALLPVARAVGIVRRRRRVSRSPHACPACGYDCRATPDRCPECGGRVATAPAPP